MELKRPLPPDRSFAQVKNHYEVEKSLATNLKQSTNREERKKIYETMYDELFEKVPDHPRLTRRENKELTLKAVELRLNLVKGFIDSSTVFVEFAPGDCRFAVELCKHVRFVYGIDISDQRGQETCPPENFRLIIYDGYELDIDRGIADIVFSDQLLEHIHPDDIEHHFKLVRHILKKGGLYIFRTPHRYTGPHDVSKYFSDIPEGFHLKEYTYTELAKILRNLNYSSWHGYRLTRGISYRLPFMYFNFGEKMLGIYPSKYRRILSKYLLPSIYMIAVK